MSAPSGTRKQRRNLDGVLLLDKPRGITSHGAMRQAQRLYEASKAGHTGTLDPLATGLLPVCFGEATKFSHVLLDAEKTYEARIRLGTTTTTGDLEGAVTARAPVVVSPEAVAAALRQFVGEIAQVPPMYSALKKDGRPLYRLAREGREVPRAPRKVVIRELALLGAAGEELDVRVNCSKGTYIRVLAEDLGKALGCGGCLAALRRTGVGAFGLVGGGTTLAELETLSPGQRDALLLPPDALLVSLPRFDLDADQARRIARGQTVERIAVQTEGLTRLYGPDQRFLGLAEVTALGSIVPRRLRAQPPPGAA